MNVDANPDDGALGAAAQGLSEKRDPVGQTVLSAARRAQPRLSRGLPRRQTFGGGADYGLSPLMWRKAPGCRSVGRVQSVALRLVCAREAEIDAFVPQEYWTVEAAVRDGRPGRGSRSGLLRLDGGAGRQPGAGDAGAGGGGCPATRPRRAGREPPRAGCAGRSVTAGSSSPGCPCHRWY